MLIEIGGTAGQSREMAARWCGTSKEVPDANHFTVLAGLPEPKGVLVRQALALMTTGRPP